MVDWLSRLLLSSSSAIPGFLSETLEVKEKAYRPSKKYESKSATTWLTLFCIIQLCNLCIHYPFHFELYSPQQLNWELSKKERFAVVILLLLSFFEFLRRKKKASSSSYTEKVLPASQSELRRKTTSEERNTSTPATTLPLLSKNFCVSIRQESRKNWKKARWWSWSPKEGESFLLPRCSLIF